MDSREKKTIALHIVTIVTKELLSQLTMKIDLITGIENKTLVVFYTNSKCWQFAVITADGRVHLSYEIFYSAEAAEREGRQWIKVALG